MLDLLVAGIFFHLTIFFKIKIKLGWLFLSCFIYVYTTSVIINFEKNTYLQFSFLAILIFLLLELFFILKHQKPRKIVYTEFIKIVLIMAGGFVLFLLAKPYLPYLD